MATTTATATMMRKIEMWDNAKTSADILCWLTTRAIEGRLPDEWLVAADADVGEEASAGDLFGRGGITYIGEATDAGCRWRVVPPDIAQTLLAAE